MNKESGLFVVVAMAALIWGVSCFISFYAGQQSGYDDGYLMGHSQGKVEGMLKPPDTVYVPIPCDKLHINPDAIWRKLDTAMIDSSAFNDWDINADTATWLNPRDTIDLGKQTVEWKSGTND